MYRPLRERALCERQWRPWQLFSVTCSVSVKSFLWLELDWRGLQAKMLATVIHMHAIQVFVVSLLFQQNSVRIVGTFDISGLFPETSSIHHPWNPDTCSFPFSSPFLPPVFFLFSSSSSLPCLLLWLLSFFFLKQPEKKKSNVWGKWHTGNELTANMQRKIYCYEMLWDIKHINLLVWLYKDPSLAPFTYLLLRRCC